MKRMPVRGLYHVALIVVAVTAFNWAFITLTNINLVTRIFAGIDIPEAIVAIVICVSAILVLWQNWVD